MGKKYFLPWVSVKDRIPKKSGMYLVYGRWAKSGRTVIDTADFSKDDGYFRVAWNFDVSHWVDLECLVSPVEKENGND